MYPFKCKPIQVNTIWGGDRVAQIRQMPGIHGMTMDITSHRSGHSVIENGEYAGKTITELLDEYPKEMLGQCRRDQMLRSSVVDAKESLSIQVHPYNEYALEHDDDLGKTEAWYVYEAKPGAHLIAGTKCSKEELKKAVEEDRTEEVVQYHDIEAGDFICIQAGQLHAIGAGMVLVEIGTNSDTTYRFYDFHRKDENGNERQLHVQKSFDVVDCSKQCEKVHLETKPNEVQVLTHEEAFNLDVIDVEGSYIFVPDQKRFYILNALKGDFILRFNQDSLLMKYTESVFIPTDCPNIEIEGKGRVLVAYVEVEEE